MRIECPSSDQLAELEMATEVLNRFHWNLSVDHVEREIWLRSGERLIARFSSMTELEVFTAGMALALSVLPEEVVAEIDLLAGE
jgi:hypothetical protein